MDCISKKDHLFGVSLAVKREVERERLRIAEEIYKTVNLPVNVIAKIVSVPEEKLKPHLIRRGIPPYFVSSEGKDLLREIDSITERLKGGEGERHQKGGKDRP